MKIILISIGTRGDMEPFLAIGEILRDKGHQVICAFPEQFRFLAEESNLRFASLGTKFIELLESDDGKAAMGGGGSGLQKFLATLRLARNQTEANKELVKKQYELIEGEEPDRIVYNGKAVYPIIWALQHKGRTIMVSPIPYMHYVRDHTHVAFNSNFGPFLNRLTYSLANFGLVTTVMISKKWLGITRKITRKQIKDALESNKAIYTISPSLFSRPDDWNENLKILGFHQRSQTTTWQPDNTLRDFLEKHQRILFITFGSMTNPEPEEKTRIIIDILERNQIPAIINTAAGGLVKLDGFASEWIHFVSRIPYDWIFPRVYGVIHHGGSGTTHLSLKYGCATMIIPHIIDQFVWNKIIYDKGAGPKGIKIGKTTTKNLEPKILELVNNDSFKEKASQIASQMAKEDFREEIHQAIIEV
jgi:UDP:flavonoid glycosyltransferase YjiC (YdhE family)